MILTAPDIIKRRVVSNSQKVGKRHTTYDATVGEILHEGKTFSGDAFILPSRGMVWVVSTERFNLPSDITGLATLRTTWTHDGILALNVGIIDPGWQGSLATALVNFSNADFEIRKGHSFLRVLFFAHSDTEAQGKDFKREDYLRQILDKSRNIPKTFLNLDSLANEMLQRFNGSPTILMYLTKLALAAAFFAIFLPILYSVSTEFMSRRADLQVLKNTQEHMQKQIDDLASKIERGK